MSTQFTYQNELHPLVASVADTYHDLVLEDTKLDPVFKMFVVKVRTYITRDHFQTRGNNIFGAFLSGTRVYITNYQICWRRACQRQKQRKIQDVKENSFTGKLLFRKALSFNFWLIYLLLDMQFKIQTNLGSPKSALELRRTCISYLFIMQDAVGNTLDLLSLVQTLLLPNSETAIKCDLHS
ncbi:hypothetical protein MJG53_010609 [Ovis ammon polii x Ovis aries]|uniref:Uncharacterized protein n=1 Tax=Ovis ammon polii x Ovis aries TaxID=2918886 RepID=A0ACB9UU80_9CETA|nr:hypothetical protein MJG53_010609 [Ovis ammon polii x Ovis aries]